MNEKRRDVRRSDAPEGYVAVAMPDDAGEDCVGCAFAGLGPCGGDRPCEPDEREDGQAVIFVLG